MMRKIVMTSLLVLMVGASFYSDDLITNIVPDARADNCGYKSDGKYHCGTNCGYKADGNYHCGTNCGWKSDGKFHCKGED